MAAVDQRRGFTLVEAVIVGVVIAVLLVSLGSYFLSHDRAKWQALVDAEPNKVLEARCQVSGEIGHSGRHYWSEILVHIKSRAPYPVDFEWDSWMFPAISVHTYKGSKEGGPKSFTINPDETVELLLKPRPRFPGDKVLRIFPDDTELRIVFFSKNESWPTIPVKLHSRYTYEEIAHSPLLVTDEIRFPEAWAGDPAQLNGDDE